MKKINVNSEYKEWFRELKQRIRQSQIRAAVRVNTTLLELYWDLGADIVSKQIESVWGSGIIKQLSDDLRMEFPDMQGFSTTNLWYIKKWYLFYSQSSEKLPQVVGEIPWGHNREIITKCKSIEEALFYAHKTIDEGWSRSTLIHFIEAGYYHSFGKAVTNFNNTLPAVQSELAAETLKDPYNFDFLSMTAGYKERELENALTDNITIFFLELGRGFAFVGRQVELKVADSSYFIDMLFYHIRLKCYVVVELKTVNFEPEFAGKLNFYVTAVDRQLCDSNDNPTIGLLICKTKNDLIVEYSLSDIHKPVGVSSYDLQAVLPKELQSALPSISEVEKGLEGE